MKLLVIGIVLATVVFGYMPEKNQMHGKPSSNPVISNALQKAKVDLGFETNDSLPHDVVVHSYKIRLEPFFDFPGFNYKKELQNTFHGECIIEFSVLNSTSKVELASAVELKSAKLLENGKAIKITNTQTARKDHLIVYTKNVLEPENTYQLQFKYSNKMNAPWQGGVYNFAYHAAAIFKTTYAREAFPCFDDPAMKANFNLSLIHPNGAKVYGNEEIESQKYFDEQRTLTTFKQTPKLSTFLVSFAIGDFIEVNSSSKSGVINRVIANRSEKGYLLDSAETAARCMDAMERLTKVKYPLTKLDHVKTVGSSAGVNGLGLAVYGGVISEGLLQTLSQQLNRKQMICNAVAKQWFGGLVTADRWGNEFLHQALAKYFEVEALKEVEELKYVLDLSKVETTLDALDTAFRATHPIVDTSSHFDTVTTQVGAALLNSIRHVLGNEVFYNGLTTYLKENAFGNAGLDTLLESWSKPEQPLRPCTRSRFNLKAKMTNSQPLCGNLTFSDYARDYFITKGIPTVEVHLSQTKGYRLSQRSPITHAKYNIPIFILDLNTNQEHVLWLLKDNTVCSSDGFELQSDGDYLFNNEGKTFAEFDLQPSLRYAAAMHPKFSEFSVHNQYYVIKQLQLVAKPKAIAEIILNAANSTNGSIHPALLDMVQPWRNQFDGILEALGEKFDFEPTLENRVYGEYFLEDAVDAEVPNVVNKTTEMFEQFKQDCGTNENLPKCSNIPPEWRRAVFKQGAKTEEGLSFIQQYQHNIAHSEYYERMRCEYGRTMNLEQKRRD